MPSPGNGRRSLMSKVTEAGGYTFVSNMPGVMLAIETASITGIKKATQHVRNAAVKNLSGKRIGKRRAKVPGTGTPFTTSTGKKSTVAGSGVYYTVSEPGEFPAIATGQLKGSVHWKLIGETGIVHTDLLHGAYLEDPKDTRPIGRRRWLKRTFDEEHVRILEIIYGAGNPASRRWF